LILPVEPLQLQWPLNISYNILCSMEVCLLSANQYEKMYWSLIKDNNTSVLNALRNVKWAKATKYPMEWLGDANQRPIDCMCDNSCFN